MKTNRYIYVKTSERNLLDISLGIKNINEKAFESFKSLLDGLMFNNHLFIGYTVIDSFNKDVTNYSSIPNGAVEVTVDDFIEKLDRVFKDKDNCNDGPLHKYFKLFTFRDMYYLMLKLNESNPKALEIIKDVYINYDSDDRLFIPLTIDVSNKTIGAYIDNESIEVSENEFIKLLYIFKYTIDTLQLYFKESDIEIICARMLNNINKRR